MDEEPGLAALFPYARVANRRVDGLAVLELGHEAHGNDGPGYIAVTHDFEFLSGGERSGIDMIEDVLANAGVVIGPTRIGKRGEVVESEVGVFGVILGGIFWIAAAPGGAIAVD